jgi:tetratricopeptide (TPR) repeat protein
MSLAWGCAPKNPSYMKDWSLEQGTYRNVMDRQRQGLPPEERPEKDPDMTAEEYESLGNQYLQEGNMDESFVHYIKALQLNPGETRVRYKVGLLFQKKGLPDEALKEKNLKKALQFNPDLWLSHNLLGMIYDRKLRFDDAIAQYEAAIAIRPDQDILLNNLGVSYYLNMEYSKSVETLLEAIAAGSNRKNPKVYNNLGLVLGKLGRHEEALKAFKEAGDSAAAYYNVGYIYFLQGRYEEAIAHYEKAIEIKPSFYRSANENLIKAKKALHNKGSVSSGKDEETEVGGREETEVGGRRSEVGGQKIRRLDSNEQP